MSDQPGQNQPSDAQGKAAQYQKMQGDQPPSAQEAELESANQPDHAAEPASSSGPEGEPDLFSQLNQAREEAEKNKEAMLRIAADLENTRRRAADDVAKAHKFAIEGFAESLLPVKDSLEAALNVEEQTLESLKEGVTATLRQLEQAFERGKVKVLDPKGEKFDPNLHQAVSMVPGDSAEPAVPSSHVVAVMQKGYLINERVLRPALVVVAQ
ncbi:MAG: nucleotide exchange factor GrpE [Limnobacter sp.]|nr:nucleotide exchange factor GrpE [Limnobacter sp.]